MLFLGIVANQIQEPVFTEGLLDLYPSASAAFSVRKLRAGYTGNALRVRRSSDNSEQNIGFQGENLNVAALESFVGAGNNGFVAKWYDQSGNTNDVSMTTASLQPQIVSSGSTLLENGKPRVWIDGTGKYLRTSNLPFSATENTIIAVSKQDAVLNGYKRLISIGAYNDGRYLGSRINADQMLAIFRNTTFTCFGGVSTSQNVSSMYNIGTSGVLRQNGAQVGTGVASNLAYGNEDIFIGLDKALGVTQGWNGSGQEFIIYASEKSSDLPGIEANINNYYSIY